MPQTASPIVENSHGRLEIAPGDPVPALSWGCWAFLWTAVSAVEPGGGMDIVLVPRFPTNRWSLPQTADPTAPGFVTVGAPAGVSAVVEVVRWPLMQKPHGATLHVIQVGIGGRRLESGETLEVVYGDQSGGSLGAQAQGSARRVAFPVFVASGQQPRFLEGIRAYVGFRVNGQRGGSELVLHDPEAPRRVQEAVAAPERIVKLEVLRDNRVIADLADGGWWVDTEIEDAEPLSGSTRYYVRATTERTDSAWSSPVWMDIPAGRE